LLLPTKPLPLPISFVTVFITALQSDPQEKLLGAFKLFINGKIYGIGPGRGDVSTTKSNHTPYDSIDIPKTDLSFPLILAIQSYHAQGQGAVLLELHIEYQDGTKSIVSTNNKTGWLSYDATPGFNPKYQEGRYNAPQEHQIASHLELGWNSNASFKPSKNCNWLPSMERKKFPTYLKPTLPLNVTNGRLPVRVIQTSSTTWFYDFGTDFMGGLHLEIANVPVNTKIKVTMSEELIGKYVVFNFYSFSTQTSCFFNVINIWTLLLHYLYNILLFILM